MSIERTMRHISYLHKGYWALEGCKMLTMTCKSARAGAEEYLKPKTPKPLNT